MEVAEVLKYGS